MKEKVKYLAAKISGLIVIGFGCYLLYLGGIPFGMCAILIGSMIMVSV